MRVLIVEDDASARRGLTELVRAWGYEAEGAADGQEGLLCESQFASSRLVLRSVPWA